jgi:hypothetical protein
MTRMAAHDFEDILQVRFVLFHVQVNAADPLISRIVLDPMF